MYERSQNSRHKEGDVKQAP